MSGALVPLGPRLVQGVVQGVAKQPATLIPMAQGLLGLVLMKDEEGLGGPALEGGLGEIQAQLRQADQAQRLADGLEIPHLQRQPRRLAQTGLEGLPSRTGLEALLLHLGTQQAAIGQEVVPIRRWQGQQARRFEQGLRGKTQLVRLQGQGEAAGETPAECRASLAHGRLVQGAVEPGHDAAQEFHPGQTGGAFRPASGLLQLLVSQVEAGLVDLLAGMGQVGREETLAGAPVDGIPVEDALGQPRGLFEGVAGEGEIQGLVENLGVLRPAPQGLVHDGAGVLEASRLTVLADEVQVTR